MITLKDYVAGLDGKTLAQIIRDKEYLDIHGQIGDCTLRSVVEDYMEITGIKESSNISWMTLVSTFAYRIFALRYMNR